jgi:acyl-CoA thioester hydrolase
MDKFDLKLLNRCESTIRFNEVDSMGILWHGHYIKLFEDGRESWGREYGLHYLQVFENKVYTPIVHSSIDHKGMLSYGDTAMIETEYIDAIAAKLIFHYRIFRKSDLSLVATGKTVQVFTNLDKQLLLNLPDFVINWKIQHGLLNT